MPLKSFISEHTAEYVLVPSLVSQLAGQFQQIIPVFFWLTREGNTTAIELMGDARTQLLTAFPRRPKVSSRSQDRITMKVNRELLEYSVASANEGISVLAGVPLVSSLSMLRMESRCCWFELNPSAPIDTDSFVEIGLDGTVVSNTAPSSALSGPLSDIQIQQAALRCPVMSWRMAVEKLRLIRSGQPEFRGFPFFRGYKPFHLVLLAS
jgi:hypothetical protein